MLIIWSQTGAYLLSGGSIHHITDPAALAIYQAAGVPVAGSLGNRIDATEEAALLADCPPGNPPSPSRQSPSRSRR